MPSIPLNDVLETEIEPNSAIAPPTLVGGGELGERLRAFDWTKTALGPISTWPQSLVTTVNLVLQSPMPLAVLWGPDGIMLYNDAYSVFAGARHPFLLGSKVLEGWSEVADFNRNVMDKGLRGESLSYKDQKLTLYRNNIAEEVWMDLNYSPILDEKAKPAGVLAIVVETTQRVLAEQKQGKAEEQFQLTMNAAGMIGTWDWYIQSDTFYSDSRFATLFSLDSVKGEQGTSVSEYAKVIHPDDLQRVEEAVQHTIATGEPYAQEYRVLQKDGSIRWIIARGQCLYKDGTPWRFPGVGVEITERKRIEEALRESEERYSLVVHGSNDGIWDWDHQTDFIFWNERCYEQLGMSTQIQITNELFADLIHPADRQKALAMIEAHLKHDAPYDIEFRLRKTSGDYGYYLARGKTVRDAQGNPIRTAGVRTDITNLKNAEQGLKDSEQRYQMLYEWEKKTRQVLQEIREPLALDTTFSKAVEVMAKVLEAKRAFIVEFDDAGQVLPVRYEFRSNDSVKSLMGICPPWDFCPYLAKAAEQQLATSIDAWNDAVMKSNPDWQHFSREYNIRGTITAPVFYQNKLINVLVLHTLEPRHWDERELFFTKIVTDQLATSFYQAQLFEKEQQANQQAKIREKQQEVVAELGFKALLGCNLPDLVDTAVGVIAKTLDVQYCKIMELQPDSKEVLLTAGAGWPKGLIGKATESTGLGSPAGYVLLKGEPVIVEDLQTETRFQASSLLLEHGVVSGISVVIYTFGKPWGVMGGYSKQSRKFSMHDVNFFQSVANVLAAAIERKHVEQDMERTQAEAENANIKKSQFLANMSHELRTPLNAIIGYSSMMKQGIAGELTEKQFKYARNIELSGKHLLDMVNDILDVSKIEAGKIQLNMQPVALEPLLNNLEDVLSGLAEQKKVNLNFYIQSGLSTMVADPTRLRQIFFNLISNAIKFNRENGSVTVSLAQNEDWVVVEVADTGVGIPKDKQLEIFTEFFQADSSTSRVYEGTGLGLALTKRLVELHQGEISFESEADIGTTFIFKIPITPTGNTE